MPLRSVLHSNLRTLAAREMQAGAGRPYVGRPTLKRLIGPGGRAA